MTQPLCILLVEDDPDQAMLYAQVLSLSGYQVASVPDAEVALADLAQATFHLLLADWDLPGMKGDALIATVKAYYPALKTVLFSNHTHVADAAAAAGADASFRKSEDIFRLRQLVGELLKPGA